MTASSDRAEWIRVAPPLAILVSVACYGFGYGCTPANEPLDVASPDDAIAGPFEASPSIPSEGPQPSGPPSEPEPEDRGSDDPPPDDRPEIARPGGPTVSGSVRFDIVAKDAQDPDAIRMNEVDWFLGSSSPSPAWSPDGSRIAHYDGRCVSIRATDGSLTRKLRTKIRKADCRAPRWSPSGKKIATSHLFHGPGVVFDVKSRKSTAVTTGDSGYWSLAFATDEQLVGRVHQSGVAMVDLGQRKRPVPLVSHALRAFTGFFPALSPSGNHLARVLGDRGGSGELEVIAVDLTTTARTSVPDPWESHQHDAIEGTRTALVRGPILELAWSYQGERLAVIRAPSWYAGYGDYDYGTGELLTVAASDGTVRTITEDAKNPTWSPDGRLVAFESKGVIWLVDVTVRHPAPWKLHKGGIEPLWSPAGDALLVLDADAHQGVILQLEGV